jgi:hypothetical protein
VDVEFEKSGWPPALEKIESRPFATATQKPLLVLELGD